jgi:hypothetical protein
VGGKPMTEKETNWKLTKIIPFLNLLLALSVIYLKVIYGSMHWLLSKLISNCNMPYELGIQYEGNITNLFRITMLLGIISVIIAWISIKTKICNRILGIIILIISVLGFIFSIFPM